MITFPRLDAMCRGVIPFCTEKQTLLQTRTSEGTEIKIAAMRVVSYLWGKVDISTSVEQQLSYIQVFVMCSDV